LDTDKQTSNKQKKPCLSEGMLESITLQTTTQQTYININMYC